MSYLIDTNVVSELVRPRPDARVTSWFERVPDEFLFISVLTLGELRKGMEALDPGSRKETIRTWLDAELPAWFEDRILPIDRRVADEWGRLQVRAGRRVAAVDSLIAATAIVHRLAVSTRNVRDFELPGVAVVSPWKSA